MKKTILNVIIAYKKGSLVLRNLRVPLFVYTDCKFYPSCSDYAIEAIHKYGLARGQMIEAYKIILRESGSVRRAIEAINKYGAAKGSVKSLVRILRCSPVSKGGIDNP